MNAAAEVWTAEPQLFTGDLAAALDFYVSQLGFTLAFQHGEPPFYAQVERGGARLNLRHADSPVLAEGLRDREPDLLAATIAVDRIEPLADTFQARGVEFAQPLRTEPWGARTFIVRDPDENLILFAGRA